MATMENTNVDAGQDVPLQEDHSDQSRAGCERLIEDNIASGSEDLVNAEPDKFAIIHPLWRILPDKLSFSPRGVVTRQAVVLTDLQSLLDCQ